MGGLAGANGTPENLHDSFMSYDFSKWHVCCPCSCFLNRTNLPLWWLHNPLSLRERVRVRGKN
jgi:hypothetical protein